MTDTIKFVPVKNTTNHIIALVNDCDRTIISRLACIFTDKNKKFVLTLFNNNPTESFFLLQPSGLEKIWLSQHL